MADETGSGEGGDRKVEAGRKPAIPAGPATPRRWRRRSRPRAVSIRTILPNMVTLLAFVMGLTAIRMGIAGKFELALASLAAAGILDGLDGTVARLLKSTSRFGAELDSLSDVVAFGVAPAVIVYLWALAPLDKLGWAAATIFSIAMALRLARFNAQLDDDEEPHKRLGFFTGVPAPVAAALMVLPLALDLSFTVGQLASMPLLIAAYAVFVALLVVSTLPTPSLKKLRIERRWFPVLLLGLGAVMVGLLARPWYVLSLLSFAYLAGLPVSFYIYRRRLKQKGWDKVD